MYNVAFITTVNHNIGDDFVREGIIYLLSELIGEFNVINIHKHSPVTVINGAENIRNGKASKILEPVARVMRLKNKLDDCNLLIQSGAPVYWCHEKGPHCADNEWYDAIIRNRLKKYKLNFPFINIAGGSCQRYHSDGTEILSCNKCLEYISEFYDATDLTLLRDNLAKMMLNFAGRNADVLPCTSVYARDRFVINDMKGEYIVVNYMENGGHYTFGQDINKEKWKQNFQKMVITLKKIGKVICACHSKKEEQLVKKICIDIDTYIIKNDYKAFIEFYSKARFGIVNRVHAGFMMASFGRPVAVIGNDSRALMIENLGLKSYYVNEINEILLDEIITGLFAIENQYYQKFELIKNTAKKIYLNKIQQIIQIK